MYKVLKNIINKVIESEFHRLEENVTNLEKIQEYLELSEKYNELETNLYKILPKEHHDLIEEFTQTLISSLTIEKKYMFKQGVIKGLTDLNYLEEVGREIIFYIDD
ncbi:hypothetical protein [Clostridium sp. Marseille-Q2269]|uniref:hypothetical protein n=1 Tax=Clostridium sp. Marseille-Q2269 TaxID=2942205 RepID=UPI002072B396|nr:hypothetical protein [Clostridium sp. Marseille-Q2269]